METLLKIQLGIFLFRLLTCGMMPRPSPLLSTTTEVMIVCRANAPKLFAPKTSAYLSIVRSAAIWNLKRSVCTLKCCFSSSAYNKIRLNSWGKIAS